MFFYISCFVLDRDGPLCFRYICKLIALYPCRLFHCMYSFVCADRKQLKIDAEQVLGMRLHNLYGVLSMHERIASSKSHLTTYMFYFLRTCSMFPGSTEASSLQFLTMHHVLRQVEWSHPGTNDYSTRRGRPPTWAHVIPQTFFYYASDVVAYKVYNRSTQCRIQSV